MTVDKTQQNRKMLGKRARLCQQRWRPDLESLAKAHPVSRHVLQRLKESRQPGLTKAWIEHPA